LLSFQSPPSTRTATIRVPGYDLYLIVSIPAVHADGDLLDAPGGQLVGVSIPAVHADGDKRGRAYRYAERAVSIPAVHADGDEREYASVIVKGNVSIPAVHADGDSAWTTTKASPYLFQSPPSTRTATIADKPPHNGIAGFNPRRPRGRRLG